MYDHPTISGYAATPARHLSRALLWLLLLLVPALALPPGAAATSGETKKQVLVLHSYHRGFKWTDDITAGIERVFATAGYPVDVQYEYMDTKKIFDDEFRRELLALYKHKFRHKHFDIILSSDDNAFNFLRQHRDEIFPGTPVVFCGVNYFKPATLKGLHGFTGVNEAADPKATIELILRLHPNTHNIALVIDETATGQKMRDRLDKIIPQFRDRVHFIDPQGVSMAELEQRLRQLPPDTVVYYILYVRDRLGHFYEFDDSIRRVVQATTLPVYVTWDFSLGYGAVGGMLTSGLAQGEMAARLALRVLDGEDPDTIPVVMDSPNRYMFDYRALQRFGIDRQQLPAASVVLNAPDELHRRYRQLIWRSLAGGLVLALIILLLLTNVLRRRRAEARLKQANEELEARVRLRTKDLMLINQHLNGEVMEHKRLLLELRKMKRAVDHSSSSIIILNRDFRVEYVNPRFTTITGYRAEEVLGGPLTLLCGDQHQSSHQEKVQALHEEHEWHGEFLNRRKDGTLYYELAAISPIFNEEGKITHYISVNEDITERKQAAEALEKALAEAIDLSKQMEMVNTELQTKNAELAQAYDQLKQAQSQILQQEKMASIGQLAAGVAHEINNPMGFIASNLGTLQKYLKRLAEYLPAVTAAATDHAPAELVATLKEQARKAKIDFILEDGNDLIDESLEGAERVKGIVQGLKTFARVDQAEFKAVDLHECLDSTLQIVWNELKYKTELVKDYGQLPLVECYPQQLGQVFMNMLVNAAQAIPERGTITIRTAAEDDWVTVAISDTGNGIAPEHQTRIFEPFFTTKPVGKGTGLGMSIAYDIIKKHGGDIELTSEVGHGTTFTIRLPVAAVGVPAET